MILDSHPESSSPASLSLSLKKRLGWLVVLLGVQLLYIPINRFLQGGAVLAIPWDARVPFWPAWAVPYLLSLFWWAGCFVWAALEMDDALYRAFVVSVLAVLLASYVVYLLYPTYVERPSVEGTGWTYDLVRLIYRHDQVYNAFPSGHTYTTVLIGLFWDRWYPRLRWLWVTIVVIVVLSTLFTGQHNLLDPIGGIILAWAGYRFGLWWAARGVRG